MIARPASRPATSAHATRSPLEAVDVRPVALGAPACAIPVRPSSPTEPAPRPTWASSSRRTACGRLPRRRSDAFDLFSGCGLGVGRGRRPRGRQGRRGAGQRHPRGNEVLAHVAARLGVADGGERGARSAPPTRSSSPARWSAARRWRRCALGRRPAVVTVAGHACDAVAGRGARPADGRAPRAPTVADARPAWPARSSVRGRLRRRRGRRPEVRARGRRCRPRSGRSRRLRRRASSWPSCWAASLGVSRVVTEPGLAPAPRAGRPDRQPDLARALHPVRHQRRDPALGRLRERQDDPRDQHRRRGADGDQGDTTPSSATCTRSCRRSTRRSTGAGVRSGSAPGQHLRRGGVGHAEAGAGVPPGPGAVGPVVARGDVTQARQGAGP